MTLNTSTQVIPAIKIPCTSRVVVLDEYGENPIIKVVERPTPKPGPGQVLVQMAAAPINPSDLLFLQGLYGLDKSLPIVPGLEGSGLVVSAGKGFLSERILGQRVACSGLGNGDGTWGEYVVMDADSCITVSPSVSDEQAASMFVNPWTAIALTEIARKGRHQAIVLTAGASQLARMMLRLCQPKGIPILHIVRNFAQVQLLESLGAKEVINSNEPHFCQQLAIDCDRLQATIAFDAVAGDMTGILAQAMPQNSQVVVYGSLASQSCQVKVNNLLFGKTTIEGFWLNHWLSKKNLLQQLFLGKRTQRLLSSTVKTEVRERLPLEEIAQALKLSASNATDGKVLLVPGEGKS
jgi:NADPH:quinone reductase-like Zn-dependent oxidoreductase